MASIDELRATVAGFDPGDEESFHSSRERTLQLLDVGETALDRRNYSPGHITASGVVLSDDRTRVVLVFHKRLGRWLQPGGHVEPGDRDTQATALREVLEETAVQARPSGPGLLVGIDIHEIPHSAREPAHLHFDLVWQFTARPAGEERAMSIWCPVGDLKAFGADAPLLRAVQRAVDST